jgi:hypothetical protein
MSGQELARLLERRGWRLLRISGRHHISATLDRQSGCLSPSMEIVR